VTTFLIVVWLLFSGANAALALIFWRRLAGLRDEVHSLLTHGKLVRELKGPRILREIHQDLHEIARRENAVARQIADEDFSLRAILTSITEGVLVADGNFRIRLTNKRLEQMFSLARSPVDRTVMEVFRNHVLQKLVEQTLETGETCSTELQIEGREAGPFQVKHFEITCVKMHPKEQEARAGALVIFHDVTQIRSLEAVRKEFIANVSHELRTPLSIITGYLETLIDGDDDPETASRFLKIMHKHAQRLNLLVEDLLALSHLESRKIALNFEPIFLPGCVDRVLEQLDSRIRERGAKFSVELTVLPTIEADPFRLESVLFNLLDNALRHGGKSGLKIRIEARSNADWVELSVQDDGQGIPLADQPHIFERFYRVRKDRSRDAGGTGLGLSIVKHTIQAHGGTVTLESVPGSGATFRIRLPVRQS
jgi:two-component system, OmpR family, phosphate regulon sensor histidine kinase PhoR